MQKHSTKFPDSMLSFDSNSSFGFCLYLVITSVITPTYLVIMPTNLVNTPTYLVIMPSITLAAAASSRIQWRLPDLNRMICDFQTLWCWIFSLWHDELCRKPLLLLGEQPGHHVSLAGATGSKDAAVGSVDCRQGEGDPCRGRFRRVGDVGYYTTTFFQAGLLIFALSSVTKTWWDKLCMWQPQTTTLSS